MVRSYGSIFPPKAEQSYSEQDAFLALKDILAGVWKSRQAQPPENT